MGLVMALVAVPLVTLLARLGGPQPLRAQPAPAPAAANAGL